MTEWQYVQVAVEAPLTFILTYALPSSLAANAKAGSRVKVPLGGRKSTGVILGESNQDTVGKIKTIKSITEIMPEPPIGEKTLRWLKWLAQYYLHPPGQVYAMAFSPGDEFRKRKAKKSSPTAYGVDPLAAPRAAPTPNPAQAAAIASITKAAAAGTFETFLLYGITGSGKTEVYLRSIESVLALGKEALVLVPEISLTPQLIKRFVERFGEKVAVLHSHLTPRERSDQWWSAIRGEKKILVGARSALFCPLENLGLIIVDEEHETSFKQDEQLKYNARDASIMRGQFSSCPVVLGSATPSLESWYNVKAEKFKLLNLPSRVENRPLPVCEIVDMREDKKSRTTPRGPERYHSVMPLNERPYWLSEKLFTELGLILENKEQAALFLNRRGFAQFALCPGCGFSESCPDCSVTLTVHKHGSQLQCHYCGFQKTFPTKCTSCKNDEFRTVGLGTEKVAEDLQKLFPAARIARADRDEINSRESLEALLDKINNGEVDFIVGTQMIAKGHDFPNLTLVGVVLADVGLHLPDFRSSERTFQLLTQVAGRAGRHQKAGRVVIQTYMPEHAAIQAALTHDFEKFAADELVTRQELGYPPSGKLTSLRIQGPHLERVEKAADQTRIRIEALQKQMPEFQSIEVLGPCEAPLAKVRKNYRFQVLLKAPSSKSMNVFLQHITQNLDWVETGVKLSVDVDPLQLL